MDEICYACGRPATSREHVPPKCLFPKDGTDPSGKNHRIRLITVPSCAEHNLGKSRDDEYLMAAIASHFLNNDVAQYQFPKVLRALDRNPNFARTVYQDIKPVMLNGQETAMFALDLGRMDRIMDLIAKGLVFHHCGEVWPHEFRAWFTTALAPPGPDAPKVVATTRRLSAWIGNLLGMAPTFGENPGIFQYQYYVSSSPIGAACVRMLYYGGIEVVAMSASGDRVMPR